MLSSTEQSASYVFLTISIRSDHTPRYLCRQLPLEPQMLHTVRNHLTTHKQLNTGDIYHAKWTYILCTWSRDVNPSFREEGTRTKHENDVEHSVYWILEHVLESLRWWEVVTQTTDGIWPCWSTTTNILLTAPSSSSSSSGTRARKRLNFLIALMHVLIFLIAR